MKLIKQMLHQIMSLIFLAYVKNVVIKLHFRNIILSSLGLYLLKKKKKLKRKLVILKKRVHEIVHSNPHRFSLKQIRKSTIVK